LSLITGANHRGSAAGRTAAGRELRACPARLLASQPRRQPPPSGKEQAQDHAYDYLKGLMVCPERTSIEPIATPVRHGDVSGLQKFVGAAPWAYDEVMAEAQALFADELAPSAAGSPVGTVGVIDESAFAKQGSHSAGVARQHDGRLGKFRRGASEGRGGAARVRRWRTLFRVMPITFGCRYPHPGVAHSVPIPGGPPDGYDGLPAPSQGRRREGVDLLSRRGRPGP
jgi:DDE superfamily endonuclease